MGRESGHFVWGPSKVVFYTHPPPQLTRPERKWVHLEVECEYLCICFYFHVILLFHWFLSAASLAPWQSSWLPTGLGWGLGRGSDSLLTDISPTPCHPLIPESLGFWAFIILLLILSLREQIKTLIITCLSAIFLPNFLTFYLLSSHLMFSLSLWVYTLKRISLLHKKCSLLLF